jgi:hypothetical protein
MTPPKRPAHRELERHNQRVAEAVAALRRAEQHEHEAEQTVEWCRDATREAHDVGADPSNALGQLREAKAALESATLRREGLGQRVKRAEADREAFHAEAAEHLLRELDPDCIQATQDLRLAVERLVAADRAWRELAATVSGHLRAAQLVVHVNAPPGHGLEQLVKDAKRSLGRELVSPAPHWHQRDAAVRERRTVETLKQEREAAHA